MRSRTAILILFAAAFGLQAFAMEPVNIRHIAAEMTGDRLISGDEWKNADAVNVSKYWSGDDAPDGRRFTARLLRSDSALYVRFETEQNGPLVVSEKPQTAEKAMNLWDRDVVEIFLAPNANDPTHYYEFEAAPNGEWRDVEIKWHPNRRESNWKYRSGMTTAFSVSERSAVITMKIPFTAFPSKPKPGDIWKGNLLRCVGTDPGRGYLAWQPTRTKEPAFHVPSAFGSFKFVK